MDTWACWWESPVERTTWSGLAERTVPVGGGRGSLAFCISPVCHSAGSSPASQPPPPNTSEPHVIPLACYQRQLESPLPYALSLSLSALASDLCAQTTKMSAALISDQTSQTSRASVQPNETLAVPATAFLVWNYNNCLDIILREQKEKCIK